MGDYFDDNSNESSWMISYYLLIFTRARLGIIFLNSCVMCVDKALDNLFQEDYK